MWGQCRELLRVQRDVKRCVRFVVAIQTGERLTAESMQNGVGSFFSAARSFIERWLVDRRGGRKKTSDPLAIDETIKVGQCISV